MCKDLDRHHDILEANADRQSALVDVEIEAIEDDTFEVQRIIKETCAELISDLYVLHRKNPTTCGALIFQQIENCIMNEAEAEVENRDG